MLEESPAVLCHTARCMILMALTTICNFLVSLLDYFLPPFEDTSSSMKAGTMALCVKSTNPRVNNAQGGVGGWGKDKEGVPAPMKGV